MKQVYLTFSLLLCGTFMNVANAQCTAVQTFSEDFETFTTFPDNCWVSNKAIPQIDLDVDATTGNHSIMFYSFFSASEPIYLVSPELSTIDGNHSLEFEVLSVNATTTTIEVGTMTDNTDFSTFSAVGSAISPTVGIHQSTNIPANAGHKYIAIKFIPDDIHQAMFLDNIKWDSSLSTPKFNTNKVTIYPNPSTSIFYLDTEIDVKSIEVYNTLGQRMLTTNQKQINLENAANGVYVANVTAADGAQASYKIVKK